MGAGACLSQRFMLTPALLHKWSRKAGQMLSFTRARNGVVCRICNLPRGTNLADVAIFVVSLEFQMQCIQPLKISNCVSYGVGSLDDRSSPSVQKHVGFYEVGLQKTVVGTCSSCTIMIPFLCLDKYVNTKLLAYLYARFGGGRSPLHLKSTDKDRNTLASCNH